MRIHKLTVIGWLGVKRAYLDLPLEEAISRYEASEGEIPTEDMITEFVFENEFGCYDAYSAGV